MMIVEKIQTYLQSEAKVWPQHVNRASELGHPCLRYLVYLRTKWDQKTPPTPEVMLRFMDGNLHEEAVLDLIRKAGIRIIEQQRPFFWSKYKISGHIDGKVLIDGQVYPIEIKSASPNIWAKIKDVEDMRKSEYVYLQKYPAQMTLYLLMDNSERGVMIFKNKATGQLKEIWVDLDYELGEQLLQKAEAVNKHVDEGTLPDRIPYDENVCGTCPFIHICLPDVIRVPVEIFDSNEFLEKLQRWWELKPLVDEWKKLDAEISKELQGKEKLLIGDFMCVGKWVERKSYTVPAGRYWKKTITKLGGEL